MEVMIHALFSEKFSLDSKLLYDDIINKHNLEINSNPNNLDRMKSIDRLNNPNIYYEHKAFNEKFDLDYTLLIKDINNMILIDEEGIDNADEEMMKSYERLKDIHNFYTLK